MRNPALALILALTLSSGGCARTLYNFGTIEPERIYRSAQPSPLFLGWLSRRHGIRSIVNLRGRTPGFESAFAARHGLRLYSFDLSASRPPAEADVERFLAILADPENWPVLVHCRNGVDRTGYMLAIYRTSVQGWTPERAAREMNRFWQLEPLNPVPQQVVRDGLRAPEPAPR
jgi:protein tyrosine/serine phosphatase